MNPMDYKHLNNMSTFSPTGADSKEVISALMKTLSDKDRLVRESGCLALGHLKAKAAVQKIVHLW